MFLNLKVSTKILAGFFAVAAVALGLGLHAASSLRELAPAAMDPSSASLAIAGALDGFAQVRAGLYDALEADQAQDVEARLSAAKRPLAEVDQRLDELEKGLWADELRREGAEAKRGLAKVRRALDDAISMIRDRREKEAKAELKAASAVAAAAGESLHKLGQLAETSSRKASDEQRARVDDAVRATWMLLGLALVAAAGIGLLLTRAIARPLQSMALAARRLSTGAADVELDPPSGDELGALADSLRQVALYLQGASGAAAALARGDVSARAAPRSPDDVLGQSLALAANGVRALSAEALRLAGAASEGHLSGRADAAALKGAYAEVAAGMNRILDGATGPWPALAQRLERFAKGELPPKIVDELKGDFAVFKEPLNRCIEAVGALSGDASQLAAAAAEGRLAAARVDPARHEGCFRGDRPGREPGARRGDRAAPARDPGRAAHRERRASPEGLRRRPRRLQRAQGRPEPVHRRRPRPGPGRGGAGGGGDSGAHGGAR